jgi:hypothetical protein
MRVTDGRGVEYDVTYDAERGMYVYMKVFKPCPEQNFMGEAAPSSNHSHASPEPSERQV